MNIVKLKSLFFSNTLLKLTSILLGYSFWYIASNHHIITLQLSIPLCFHGFSKQYTIKAPEKIMITLRAKRADFYALSHNSLAIHKNIEKLLPGKHGILIKKQDLFLPETIQLVECKPSNLVITIETKENTKE